MSSKSRAPNSLQESKSGSRVSGVGVLPLGGPLPSDELLLSVVEDKTFDSGQSSANSVLIVDVLVAEKVEQSVFFLVDSVVKELPTGDRVADETKRILQ